MGPRPCCFLPQNLTGKLTNASSRVHRTPSRGWLGAGEEAPSAGAARAHPRALHSNGPPPVASRRCSARSCSLPPPSTVEKSPGCSVWGGGGTVYLEGRGRPRAQSAGSPSRLPPRGFGGVSRGDARASQPDLGLWGLVVHIWSCALTS